MAGAAEGAWLEVRGLVAGYMPGIDILRDVSVEAICGQVRCVLGPNGTGKSTLVRSLAVAGLLDKRKVAIIDADPQGGRGGLGQAT